MGRWVAACAIGACSMPLYAQESGRWWFDGVVSVESRNTENLAGGATTSEFDQQDLRIAFGVNGFVGAPRVGKFRLGLDLLLSELEGGRVVDADRSGIDGSLHLFPRGAFPARFFYRRQKFEFSPAEDDDPLALTALPELNTQWGANLRVGRGGPLVGFESTRYDFLSPNADDESNDRQFVDWVRSDGRLQHRIRFERRRRDFGTVDLEIEDRTANFHQRAELSGASRWELTATGIVRDIATAGVERSTEDLRIRNRFVHEVGTRDLIDLSATLGRLKTDIAPTLDRYGVSLFYRWRPDDAWEIAPFAQYSDQSSDDQRFRSPRAGVAITWRRQIRAADLMVTSRGSYGILERRLGSDEVDESQGAFGMTASLGNGGDGTLRREIEVEHARNDTRLTSDPVLALPDLGLSRQGLGNEDLSRARLTLSHRRASRSVSAWAEWSLRESTSDLPLSGFRNETVSSTLQYGGRRFNVQLSGAETRVDQESVGDQTVRFVGVSANARLRRGLSVRASYRMDIREVVLAPDLDSEFFEAVVRYEIGQITLEGRAFESRQQVATEPGRSHRGVRWSISRSLSGWLPIGAAAGR